MSSQFEGVDLEGIKTELQTFIEQAAPVNQSGPGFITTESEREQQSSSS